MGGKGNIANLKHFTSEYQPIKKGRKPTQLKPFLKENNVGTKDICIIANNIVTKSIEELKAIAADQTKPILIVGSAVALLKDIARGRTSSLQWLIDRAFGKAEETVNNRNLNASVSDLTPEARDMLLKELIGRLNIETEDSGTCEEVRPDSDTV